MENKNVKKWEPIGSMPRDMFLEGLYDDYEGFRLLLKGQEEQDKSLTIKFSTYIGYRTTEETARSKTLHEITIQGVLSRCIDSEYLNWIKEESGSIFSDMNLVHYMVCCSDSIIDIISAEEPVVEWLEM